MDCPICVAKTKALISLAVTVKLICVFVFGYAKSWFSHDWAYILFMLIRILKNHTLYPDNNNGCCQESVRQYS